MTKLKPCPFCGGEAEFESFIDHYAHTPACIIRCTKCGTTTKVFTDTNHTFDYKDEAATMWNRRIEK